MSNWPLYYAGSEGWPFSLHTPARKRSNAELMHSENGLGTGLGLCVVTHSRPPIIIFASMPLDSKAFLQIAVAPYSLLVR